MSFPFFPMVALDYGDCPPIPFRIVVNHVTISSSNSMPHLRWSTLWQKIGNSWKLLETIVTESFVLNVTGLLDPTLKLIKYFIHHLHQVQVSSESAKKLE